MLRVLADTFNFEIDPVVIQNGRKLHFSAVGSNKYIGRARPHLWVISFSFWQELQHQCEKMWPSVGKKSCWRSILPPTICFFLSSMIYLQWEQIPNIAPERDHNFWALNHPLLVNMTILSNTFDKYLLFGMRYQEDVFCQPRNETFFHGYVKNGLVLVLFDLILPYNMICDIDFSFKMSHSLFKIPKKLFFQISREFSATLTDLIVFARRLLQHEVLGSKTRHHWWHSMLTETVWPNG